MKKRGSQFYLTASAIIWTAVSVLRFVLEVIGYATIAEDAKEAHGVLKVLAEMALALPWWAIWWPLIISYVCAAGIAFDFSFDVLKRVPKYEKQSPMEILNIHSGNFQRYFSFVENDNYRFLSKEGEIDAFSHVEIFRDRLEELGITPPRKTNNLSADIGALKSLIARYKPFLQAGNYEKAIEVGNETVDIINGDY